MAPETGGPAPDEQRGVLRSPLGIIAVAAGIVVLLGIAVPVGLRYLGCGETRYLRVATTLSMTPLLQEAADEFNDGEPTYSGVCVFAQAKEMAPHRITTELSGGGTGRSTLTPDVWVPESSAWVELTRVSEAGARAIETRPRSLATSPVVLTAPEGTKGVPAPDRASWKEILPGERTPDRPMVMVDPNRGVDGMTAMYAVRQILGRGDKADTAMTDFVHGVQRDTAFGEIDLTGVYPSTLGVDPLTVVPEQAVIRYNDRTSDTPLKALYPTEGTVELDYPYVSVGDDPVMRAAADDLYDLLLGDDYQDRLRELGFRDPDGTAAGDLADRDDIIAEPSTTYEDLTGDALLGALEDWNRLSMATRALVLADVSKHMSSDLNGGPSRLEVTKDAAQLGLSLFPDRADMGLWLLSSGFGSSGRDEVRGIAELGGPDREDASATRREKLSGIAEDISVEGGEPRLYDNILAAYEEVEDAYDEDKINTVILLTAGQDGGSSEISQRELVAELEDRFDPDRPVTMFIIAFGEQPEESGLREVAAATSGSLFVTDDPDEIGEIFLSSVSRRLCVPNCDE
ncbi:substrate-binding and VWA domain-containing protein [Nocardiopsis rhodophaea]|uniref:Substrate-binding and VWA domain-containing protein n=1 Tax=Nocardiopsis rhodophaea TaxID=280238 RepID=A0ABP5ER18_9ACTN